MREECTLSWILSIAYLCIRIAFLALFGMHTFGSFTLRRLLRASDLFPATLLAIELSFVWRATSSVVRVYYQIPIIILLMNFIREGKGAPVSQEMNSR